MQLSVGSHEFIGEGRTRQAARHNAAMKALQALRNEPIPERPPQVKTHLSRGADSIQNPYQYMNVKVQVGLGLIDSLWR